jgi:hypothetical protein
MIQDLLSGQRLLPNRIVGTSWSIPKATDPRGRHPIQLGESLDISENEMWGWFDPYKASFIGGSCQLLQGFRTGE